MYMYMYIFITFYIYMYVHMQMDILIYSSGQILYSIQYNIVQYITLQCI